jgi:hypothetical protein
LPLPALEPRRRWWRVVDTTLAPPDDIDARGSLAAAGYRLGAHGVAVFEAR